MKKILTLLLTIIVALFSISSTFAAGTDFKLVNNEGELEINTDTIFVGTSEKNTSIIDLFSKIEIDGVNVENYLNILDVRYVSPDKVDYKINKETDIIDAKSKIYVLFKSIEDGGLTTNNSKIKFKTKNLILEEIGTISNEEDNSYNSIYNVNYTIQEEVENNNIKNVEEKIIDNKVLKENNTGIKENLFMLLIISLFLGILLTSPIIRKV